MSASGDAQRFNHWELGAAFALLALGAYIVWEGFNYGLGSLNRIGPGFFPVAVGTLLMMLAAGIMFQFRRSTSRPPKIPVRPAMAIIAGMVVFGLLIGFAGLVPATFVLVVVSSFGDRSVGLMRALIVAAAISLIGYLIFILGFGLPLQPFWW